VHSRKSEGRDQVSAGPVATNSKITIKTNFHTCRRRGSACVAKLLIGDPLQPIEKLYFFLVVASELNGLRRRR
jgi:hypothetical protein